MNKILIKRIIAYLKKDTIFLLFSILLSALSVLFTLYVPILLGNAIDCIHSDILNDLFYVEFDSLKIILTRIIIVIMIIGLLQWIIFAVNNFVTYRTCNRLRKECFKKLLTLPLSYLDAHTNGETLSTIINDVDQFADGLLLGLTQVFTGVATIIGTIIFMCIINYVIAILVIIITPLSLFVAKFIAKRTYLLFKEQSKIRSMQTGLIEETIGNLKVVKSFNYEERSIQKFEKLNEELAKTSLNATFYSSITNPATRFVNSVVYALVALLGGLIAVGAIFPAMIIEAGTLTSFLSYANQYTKPFNEISQVITELQNAFACARRIFDLLDEENEIEDKNNLELSKVNGNITLNGVYFSYNENQKLIENFNLVVEKGKHVAIVGPTGCGKTTLINLLMRFYDVKAGSIKLENVDIRDLLRSTIRNNFGMVLQDTWIKNATVKENIALGKKDATLDEIIDACKKAHVHSIIERLPNGYDTVLKNEGMLSSGERQLLCIARVMLIKPPMLILDEATSSIDTRTELKIQQAFDTLMEGKTTFIVAHRLSTIQKADIILVMKDGNIIEQGTHEQLLKNPNGFYANLYQSQFIKY